MIAAQAAALALAINAPTHTPRLKHSIVAAEVYDLDAHRVLFARNAAVLMVAASTTKLLTEGTSLALLGPAFRWTTPVYRTGPIDARGVLRGDLCSSPAGIRTFRSIRSDGTLAFENEDHACGKVFAKTGTDDSENFLDGGGVIEKGLAGYITTRGGRHVAFAFYLSAIGGPHGEDTGKVAGQILGAMATATYAAI